MTTELINLQSTIPPKDTWSRHFWLKAHETEIGEYLKLHGIAETQTRYHIRYCTLDHMFNFPKLMGEDEFLKHAANGAKAKYIREHKIEMVEFVKRNGVLTTMKKYHLSAGTVVDRLLYDLNREGGNDAQYRGGPTRISAVDRAFKLSQDAVKTAESAKMIAEIAQADNARLRKEIQELKEQFSQFQAGVANHMTKALVGQLFQGMEVSESLNTRRDNLLAVPGGNR